MCQHGVSLENGEGGQRVGLGGVLINTVNNGRVSCATPHDGGA